MIRLKLRKAGNSYVVTIPREEVERRGLKAGELVGVEITRLDVRPVLRPELRSAFEASWRRSEAAYRLLAEEPA